MQPQFKGWTDLIDNHPSLQLLEYMKNGDMALMLDKIAYSDTAELIRAEGYFIKQCWKIFICRKTAPLPWCFGPCNSMATETAMLIVVP